MKRWLPLVVVGGIAAAACTDTPTPTQPPNPTAPELLQVQGKSHIHIMLRKPNLE